eukprot:comp18140_c1_seq1/m.18877 comp18140_c1_seq1/g.18877  ORF comp18140_c1_seq1/g.18877 comp18140_c1_seq1/m.18877 type:complete len:132 (-) comp18140_c1_seq1:272-667(-)
MDDPELAAIRAKRMAEMQAQQAAAGGRPAPSKDDQEARRKQEAEMRNTVLLQILTQDARARLGRIAVIKPEKARGVEDMLIRLAQSGQLGGKVDEQQLIGLLDQVAEATTKKTTIHYQRRKVDSDDDDDDF